jgi:hypothetical protein
MQNLCAMQIGLVTRTRKYTIQYVKVSKCTVNAPHSPQQGDGCSQSLLCNCLGFAYKIGKIKRPNLSCHNEVILSQPTCSRNNRELSEQLLRTVMTTTHELHKQRLKDQTLTTLLSYFMVP